MRASTIVLLQIILWISLAGSAVVQLAVITSPWWDQDAPDRVDGIMVALIVLAVLGILALQVVAVSILRLLILVRKGRVFSARSFREVDRIVVAVLALAAVVLGVPIVGAIANRLHPGDAMAPGMVLVLGGLALVVAGVALVIRVQRQLLVQATETLTRAEHLQSELDEVI